MCTDLSSPSTFVSEGFLVSFDSECWMTPENNEDQSERMIEKVINYEHLFGMQIVFLVTIRIMLVGRV